MEWGEIHPLSFPHSCPLLQSARNGELIASPKATIPFADSYHWDEVFSRGHPVPPQKFLLSISGAAQSRTSLLNTVFQLLKVCHHIPVGFSLLQAELSQALPTPTQSSKE